MILRSSKKATFEGGPSRNSVEKHVRSDFLSIFALSAQTQTYEKYRFSLGFLGVFAVSLKSPLLRANRFARAKIHRKKPENPAPGLPKSTQDRPKSLFGPLVEPIRSTKSVENASSSDLGSTWSVEKACRSDCRGDLGRSWLARGASRGGQIGRVGAQGSSPLRVIRIGIVI